MAEDDVDMQHSEATEKMEVDTEVQALPRMDDPDEKLFAMLPSVDPPVIASMVNHWHISNWHQLPNRAVGPVFSCGGIEWRLLLFPRGNNQLDTCSAYIEVVKPEDADDDWHACAQFAIYASNPSHPEIFQGNNSTHRFMVGEWDWGFTRFLSHREVSRVSAERPYPIIENDEVVITTILKVFEDETGVLWHNFNNYDSKKATGMVGFQNQGATCYMNSLLQSLFFTNAFRKAVYQIPTTEDVPTKSVPLALQRVFFLLQTADAAIPTHELTKSFGWDSYEAFMQHDVQEFNRVLQDHLETKMKGTPAEGAIERLFVGKMKSFVRCVDVDFESSRVENFYDIQLNVKGCKNLEESFQDYIQMERLDGDNKYHAEQHGLQDADKGVIFESFPPVLHLQLKRFEYDMERDAMVKINDRHEFPLEIDLEPYLSEDADRSKPWKYILHGVLVHSGDLHSGHYYALLKPTKDSPWFKFDDDRVNRVRMDEVLDANFGEDRKDASGAGERFNMMNTKMVRRFTNAYMLVYIRECERDEILKEVTPNDIPAHLEKNIKEEEERAEALRREKEEIMLSLQTTIVTDDFIQNFQGFDLVDFNDPVRIERADTLRVRKTSSWEEYLDMVGAKYQLRSGSFRLWNFSQRQNKTVRVDSPIKPKTEGMSMEEIKFTSRMRDLRFYLEVFPKRHEPPKETQMIIFVKYYSAQARELTCLGKIYVEPDQLVKDAIPQMLDLNQFDSKIDIDIVEVNSNDISILIDKEIKPGMIEPVNRNQTFAQCELQSGDILCYQRKLNERELALLDSDSFPSTVKFYEYLQYRSTITLERKPLTDADFSPDSPPDEPMTPSMFDLEVSRKLTVSDLINKVATKIGADAGRIRLFYLNETPIPMRSNPTLETVLKGSQKARLWYEVLDIDVSKLEDNKYVKVNWLDNPIKDPVKYKVLVPINGVVADVTKALVARLGLDADTNVTCWEQPQYGLPDLLPAELSLKFLHGNAEFYAQNTREEDVVVDDKTEAMTFVFVFNKDPSRPWTTPFPIKIGIDEAMSHISERLQQRMEIPDKEWQRVRIAKVDVGKYGSETVEYPKSVDDTPGTMNWQANSVIGVDMVDRSGRSNKRATEHSIKINA